MGLVGSLGGIIDAAHVGGQGSRGLLGECHSPAKPREAAAGFSILHLRGCPCLACCGARVWAHGVFLEADGTPGGSAPTLRVLRDLRALRVLASAILA